MLLHGFEGRLRDLFLQGRLRTRIEALEHLWRKHIEVASSDPTHTPGRILLHQFRNAFGGRAAYQCTFMPLVSTFRQLSRGFLTNLLLHGHLLAASHF